MEKTSTGLRENTAGLLCYLAGWITGIIFFVLEKENKVVRFHALQSIIVFGALHVAVIILVWLPLIGGFLSAVAGITAFICWIIGMVKAYQGNAFRFPWAGNVAAKQVEL